jgi:hypothetical protein
MRKLSAVALVMALSASAIPAGLAAAEPSRRVQGPPQTGTINVVAKDAKQQNLPNVKVQVRRRDGSLAATGTTNAQGAFSFAGLNPGTYTVEILDAAGNIVGTAAVSVTAGVTATVTIYAAAAGAIEAAGAGGLSLLGLGTIGTLAVVGAATAITIVAIRATQPTASGAR